MRAVGLRADIGPARPAISGHTVAIDVVVDSAVDADLSLSRRRPRSARGPTRSRDRDDRSRRADPIFTVVLGDETLSVEGAIRPSAAAELRLSSPRCARWSVTDSSGGAWFPEGVLAKWDVHHRPFFHGHDVTVAVPAESLHVVCARGLEFDRTELDVDPTAGETLVVECDPPRLFDPAAEGWYGGDLHVHMNYSGDLICTPGDAARMQLGEGLHLPNLVVGNLSTSLVYDREMLEQTAGTDLPWSTGDAVARMGVEYRNDLLGHVHALGPSAPPTRYYAGHENSDHPEDWPPNKVGVRRVARPGRHRRLRPPRARGVSGRRVDRPLLPRPAIGRGPRTRRRCRARRRRLRRPRLTHERRGRSVPLPPPALVRAAARRHRRDRRLPVLLPRSRSGLQSSGLGAGLRAPRRSGPVRGGVQGGHPGRAHGGDQRSVARLRGQRTGPRRRARPGPRRPARLRARVRGPGAEHLTLVGPDGVMAEGDATSELRFETTVEGPTWIAAVARGTSHPNTLDESVLAHTSPVYVDVAGRRVARAADARWCLEFLDSLERLVDEHGHFDPTTRDDHFGDLVAVLDQARSFYRQVAKTANR